MLVTENSDCHSCITLWHPHACAYAAILEEEDTTMYLEQSSAAFNALPSQHGTFWEPSSLNSVILDRWRSIRVICPKRQHFYEGMTAVVTTRGLLRQGDFCDKLHLNPCLYSSLHTAPSCIK